ncbi:MAG: response regulator [Reyranella sp.]|nr:MAG: response regulator [Reyranella sp.]
MQPLSHYARYRGVVATKPWKGRGLSSLEGRTVLVVEDDPAIGLDLRMALTRVGAVIVGPAGSVAAAFAALADQAVDAAILDIRLKNNELVFAVADALAALRIPFVFASGRSAALMPLKHSDRPFFDKPFQSAEVVEALSQLVNPSRA